MSADELRRAADLLRELAITATPGPWSAADEHGLIPEADAAWCISQMRPGYQAMSPTKGYIGDVAEVWCDRKDACPDASYIAMMHPGVGLALAAVLDAVARDVDMLNEAGDGPCSDATLDFNLTAYGESVALARAILGGAS